MLVKRPLLLTILVLFGIDMKQLEWTGHYKESWGDNLVPDAFSHPAKVQPALARKIVEHIIEMGYIAPGSIVCDPFAGIAGFALACMRNGLHYRGVELEPKFHDLAQKNIELWNSRYKDHFPTWGTAEIIEGDSRRLVELLDGAGCVVSSPPFVDGLPQQDRNFTAPHDSTRNLQDAIYGDTPGQLGEMREGKPVAVVSSPPFEESIPNDDRKTRGNVYNGAAADGSHRGGSFRELSYGSDPANIGNDTGDTFWQAAAEIVAQCYQLLPPGGVAAWVTGDFVRKKKRVYFGRQWLALCESVGFVGLEWIIAWKREPGPVQMDIFGNGHDQSKDRISFFRRLANQKNPENAILNEDVIIVQKPGDGGGVGIVSSPPYSEAMGNGGRVTEIDIEKGLRLRRENYGHSPGQLGSMKEGDPPNSV